MDQLREGVLNTKQLEALHALGVITGDKIDAEGSAMDLHLGKVGWRLKGSIKQIVRDKPELVEDVCDQYGERFELSDDGMEFDTGGVVVFRLNEAVDFSQHPWLYGEATGKSSIGRLDILTRLLANGNPEYERVPSKYKGSLYAEVVPISFAIRLYPGTSLNQLRIHCGPMEPLDSLTGRRLVFFEDKRFCATAQEDRTLSLDISTRDHNGAQISAFRLRDGSLPVLDFKDKGKIDPKKYFEVIKSEKDALEIEVDRFYILRSIERLQLPPDIAVTGMAYSENLGELRIHYAGFAHPWFGVNREDGRTGTPLIFEVRAHNFPIVLRHEEVFASIRFYKMSDPAPEPPQKEKQQKKNDYSEQELKLSNYFASDSQS